MHTGIGPSRRKTDGGRHMYERWRGESKRGNVGLQAAPKF